VVLLDGVVGDPVELVAELDEALQKLPVLVILDPAENERAHDCVVAGARGCLVRPVDPNALAHTIFRVHERAVRRRKQLEAEAEAAGKGGGRLIAVRGAKGGVGATVIATNLAVAIRRQSDRRVVLVDANFFGGDVPGALNLVPDGNIADLLPHLHVLDDDLLASTLVEHPSGVAVLAAPTEFERAEAIRSEEFQRVLEVLRARYDYVVLDCSPFLDHNTVAALDQADLVLLVSTPEIVSLKNAGRFILLGAELGYSDAKMRLVINRLRSPGAIRRADFERHLEYRMSFGLPNDTAVVQALTRGEPLVTFQRTSRAARALDRLARTVLANRGWEGEPRPLGRRLLRLPSLRLLPRPGALRRGPERA
jgi:pilus assembly protein CpaE